MSEDVGYYPKLVEDARRWAEFKAEHGSAPMLNIIVYTADPEHPDPVAAETARRVRKFGCQATFERSGGHRLIFFGALPEEPKEEEEED